jgi:signal transduction histidine kinase/ActR/RegA family two-component response regulator
MAQPEAVETARNSMAWELLPGAAQAYVAAVTGSGSAVLLAMFPAAFPLPWLLTGLIIAACLTASWKVNLMMPLGSGSTLSVSCAAKLAALLLLGPGHSILVAAAAAITQCTYKVKQRYPLYRTAFSVAAEALTMGATGIAFIGLGGRVAVDANGALGELTVAGLARPLVGAIVTYFMVNTSLVAAAIALSTRRQFGDVWRHDFLWSGVTYMVAGTAGAVAAIVITRGDHWIAILLLAPVYLTYRTYLLFLARFEDQQRHMTDMRRMHAETVQALSHAHQAERALANEKERLAVALADMTRLEEARNQLLEREQAARTSAEAANRLKDQFLAVVSHELRTPLNSILGWADMLRRGMLDPARRDRAHQTIYDSARQQAQLIEDLLDVSRIMSGKLRLARALVDFEEVVRRAIQIVQPSADARHVQIRVLADQPPGQVFGDAARLQQIVLNLVSNAIKFSHDGGVIELQLRSRQGSVELSVSDCGQGIAPDFLESVFEPFRQGDGSSTRLHGGLGLGLSIVKHLVDAHGGTVSAQSAGEGSGATFVVALPMAAIATPAEDPLGDRRRPEPPAPFSPAQTLDGVSVLVVDDDEQSRLVVAAHLEAYNAAVITAPSAAAALDVLQRQHVDVLLADIAMPGEDGYSLIRKLRALEAPAIASIPAAALTAFARNEDRQQALEAGFQLHLAKPIDAETLVSAVATLGRGTADPGGSTGGAPSRGLQAGTLP